MLMWKTLCGIYCQGSSTYTASSLALLLLLVVHGGGKIMLKVYMHVESAHEFLKLSTRHKVSCNNLAAVCMRLCFDRSWWLLQMRHVGQINQYF